MNCCGSAVLVLDPPVWSKETVELGRREEVVISCIYWRLVAHIYFYTYGMT